MFQARWDDIKGRELRYGGHTWKLTGDISIEDSGSVVSVEARQIDGVKGDLARLQFDIDGQPHSLNPGNTGEHFNRLERVGQRQYLVIKNEGRTYRYELHRIEYV
ncbi:hypothetical protein [Haloarchaeobius sp. TZWSO28]|uniref:hypothetical protein n=1 Tax=Haloarchaeobius sp. TZWSO28 TaxID=3446119 RepID=UPI003EBFCBCE